MAHSSNQRCMNPRLTSGSLNSCLLIRTFPSNHVTPFLMRSMDWPVANKCPYKNILFASGASYLSCPSLPHNMVLVSYSAPAFVMIPPKKCLTLKQRKSQFLPPNTESMKPTSLRSCAGSRTLTMESVPKYGRFCRKKHFLA